VHPRAHGPRGTGRGPRRGSATTSCRAASSPAGGAGRSNRERRRRRTPARRAASAVPMNPSAVGVAPRSSSRTHLADEEAKRLERQAIGIVVHGRRSSRISRAAAIRATVSSLAWPLSAAVTLLTWTFAAAAIVVCASPSARRFSRSSAPRGTVGARHERRCTCRPQRPRRGPATRLSLCGDSRPASCAVHSGRGERGVCPERLFWANEALASTRGAEARRPAPPLSRRGPGRQRDSGRERGYSPACTSPAQAPGMGASCRAI
jgi:hypothetical protein